MHPKVKFKG